MSKRPGGQLGRIWKLEVDTSSFMSDEDLQVVRNYCAEREAERVPAVELALTGAE